MKQTLINFGKRYQQYLNKKKNISMNRSYKIIKQS